MGDPSCAPALRGLNTVICVGRATDNNMEAIRFNPSTGFNSGFRNLGGVYASDASCANRAEGRDTGISCVARATNDSLFGFIVSP